MTETKILLIDSDETFSDMVKKDLSANQISISAISGGEQALKCLELTPEIDVVLIEVQLAASEDFKILREIQRQSPTIRLVLLADPATLDLAIEGMRLGAYDYLIKPGESRDLVAKIEEAKNERTQHLEKILLAGAKVLKQKWLSDMP